jgi:hypothetical protein
MAARRPVDYGVPVSAEPQPGRHCDASNYVWLEAEDWTPPTVDVMRVCATNHASTARAAAATSRERP